MTFRIKRISTEGREPLPGSDAPEGREVLIFQPARLGRGWYRAIKAPRKGCLGARWKIFDYPGVGDCRHAPSDFEPELYMEIL